MAFRLMRNDDTPNDNVGWSIARSSSGSPTTDSLPHSELLSACVTNDARLVTTKSPTFWRQGSP